MRSRRRMIRRRAWHAPRAALSRGRLADARRQFLAAAAAAAAVDDTITRAEAAIGGGGLWLYELRVVDERAAYLELVRDALNSLHDERPDLQLRLRARLAAEATYDESGTLDELRAVVDEARALRDATALAESLSLLHHAMLTPRYAANDWKSPTSSSASVPRSLTARSR